MHVNLRTCSEVINNNILDRKHFEAEDAGETEKAVYAAYLEIGRASCRERV